MKYCHDCDQFSENNFNYCTKCGQKLLKENRVVPWYFNTITIAVLFTFSFMIVPFIVGVFALIKNIAITKKAIQKLSLYMDEEEMQKSKIKSQMYAEFKEKIKIEEATEKKKIDDLKNEIKSLKDSKEYIIEQYRKNADDICNAKISETEDICKAKSSEVDDICKTRILETEEKCKKIKEEYDAEVLLLKSEKEQICNEKIDCEKQLKEIESKVIYEFSKIEFNDNITSEEYKNKLSIARLDEEELIKSGKAIVMEEVGNKKIQKEDTKQILRCFNSECAALISSVTVKNIDSYRNKMVRSYNIINRIFLTDKVSLSKEILDSKLNQLTLKYQYEQQKEAERLQQKAIREQMIEEEKVRREIELQKKKIEKEEVQFSNEIKKLMKYLQKSDDVEKQLYISRIKDLQEKLDAIEKNKENLLEREQNTRAGFVYIISNIGSFGENIYKIGMTRRLEPMDRISELSSASVPFEFDVHAMIFSDDAPALETALHNAFADKRVNLVNPRKEFFHVSLDEIESVVKKNYNATVTFTKLAEACQYRESLKMRETATV